MTELKASDFVNAPTFIFPQFELADDCYARLRMQLNLYDDFILATRFSDGVPGATFVVEPTDLASVLADLPVRSGFLPQNCLFWSKRGGQERLAIYVEPKVWPVSVKQHRRTWHVPLPGFVFVGRNKEYVLYAVREAPVKPNTRLYNFPAPNISNGVCAGNAPFPVASGDTIWQAVDVFFQSGFNNHLDNGKSKQCLNSILDMWHHLNREKAESYPLNDLIFANITLANLINS
jgi:hypothetical protein